MRHSAFYCMFSAKLVGTAQDLHGQRGAGSCRETEAFRSPHIHISLMLYVLLLVTVCIVQHLFSSLLHTNETLQLTVYP